MPRYEIVAHLSVDLHGTTPEAAAAAFKRDLCSGAGDAVTLHSLAVWRPTAGPLPATLPAPLRRHLADFFVGVQRCAATAEAAFRVRVEEIFARTTPDAADALGAPLDAAVVIAETDGGATAGWEEEGGAIASSDDVRREQP